MNPKEKAQELFKEFQNELLKIKYRISGFAIHDLAKECALICAHKAKKISDDAQYWDEVKTEIYKL